MGTKLKFKKGDLVQKRLPFRRKGVEAGYEYLIILEKLETITFAADRWCVWDPQLGIERVVTETLLENIEIESGKNE